MSDDHLDDKFCTISPLHHQPYPPKVPPPQKVVRYPEYFKLKLSTVSYISAKKSSRTKLPM